MIKIISTHTLTWSVTEWVNVGMALKHISTHTLTWSVTPAPFLHTYNSHISTHTLTWSVTSKIVSIVGNFSFQLTRSRGA